MESTRKDGLPPLHRGQVKSIRNLNNDDRCSKCCKPMINAVVGEEFCLDCWNKDFCVYLIECDKFLKVGTTGNLKKRMASLKAISPYDIKVISETIVFTKHNGYELEKIILTDEEISRSKHHGEWLNKNAGVIERFNVLASHYLAGLNEGNANLFNSPGEIK